MHGTNITLYPGATSITTNNTNSISVSNYVNITNASTSLSSDVPLLGWPGRDFYSLHITALVSLTISVLASSSVLVILRPSCPSFWRRNIGERLVVYLAVCDLLFSVSHILDHAYMIHVEDHPPDDICTGFTFFVATFVLTQAFMVCFMAVNGFLLVVRERKVSLGRYDWRLIVSTVAGPVSIMVPAALVGWLGQSGGWCITDMRTVGGKILTNIMSLLILLTIVACCLSYIFIWVKVRKVTTNMAQLDSHAASKEQGQHHSVARVMALFVFVYILQWMTYVVYSVWALVDSPPAVVVNVAVFTCNMGGVFNLIAYTLVRRRLVQGPARRQPSSVQMSSTPPS